MAEVTPFVPWVVAAASLAWGVYLKGHSNRVHMTDKHDSLIAQQDERIRQLELEMARQQSPLMKQVQDLLSKGLHHPDPSHRRQDALLEKLDQTKLEPHEIPELEALLQQQTSNPKTPEEELEAEAAKALIALMPLVVKEKAATVEMEKKK